jgi:hypothetical protein
MLVTMPLLGGGGGASPLLGEVPEAAMSRQRGGNEKGWWCPGCGRNAHAARKNCTQIRRRRRKDCVVVAAVSDYRKHELIARKRVCACVCAYGMCRLNEK